MPKNWEWVSELRRAPTEHRVTLSIGHSYVLSFGIGFSLIISPGGKVSSLSPQISLFHALMWHLPFSQPLDIQHPLSTSKSTELGLGVLFQELVHYQDLCRESTTETCSALLYFAGRAE